jgi:hypothetical protein
VPQIAKVGLVGGFRDDGAIGTQEEPAAFRRNTRALRVLRDSGPVKRKGRSLPHPSPRNTTRRASALRDCSAPREGTRLGSFEEMTVGVGPVLPYAAQFGRTGVAAVVKWLPQIRTQNTLKGNYIWFKVGVQF